MLIPLLYPLAIPFVIVELGHQKCLEALLEFLLSRSLDLLGMAYIPWRAAGRADHEEPSSITDFLLPYTSSWLDADTTASQEGVNLNLFIFSL